MRDHHAGTPTRLLELAGWYKDHTESPLDLQPNCFQCLLFSATEQPWKTVTGQWSVGEILLILLFLPLLIVREQKETAGRRKSPGFQLLKPTEIGWRNFVVSVLWTQIFLEINLNARTQRSCSPASSFCLLKVKLTLCETSLRKNNKKSSPHNHA